MNVERGTQHANGAATSDRFVVQHSAFIIRQLLVAGELIRAHSAAGAGLAVWVGAHLAGARWHAGWFEPMAVAFLLSAAGNADNDAHDAALDRLNRPQRPIPRGAATPAAARALALAAAALALLIALRFGPASTLGTLVAIAGPALYTRRLKQLPLVGNTVVGALAGMAMGYGGLLAGNVAAVILPGSAMVAFFTGRELLKTLYDLPGDRALGLRTAATAWGPAGTLRLATALWGGSAGLLATYGGPVFGGGALALLAALLLPLWRHPDDRATAGRVLAWSKGLGLAVLVGLLWLRF